MNGVPPGTSRRPGAGRASVVSIPAPMGGVYRCPIRIPTRPASMTGNATASSPKSVSSKACAPSAEESPFLLNAACAAPVARRSARPSAPGTPGPRPKAGSTAAGTRRTAEGSGGREAGSVSEHIETPACARDAGTVLPSRAGRPAGLAVTPGKRPNKSSMPPAGPRASAAGAEDMPLTMPPAAVPALLWRPGAVHGRTRPDEGATPIGVRGGVARTVANLLRERRGACRARTGPGCARAGIGAFRSFRLATP